MPRVLDAFTRIDEWRRPVGTFEYPGRQPPGTPLRATGMNGQNRDTARLVA